MCSYAIWCYLTLNNQTKTHLHSNEVLKMCIKSLKGKAKQYRGLIMLMKYLFHIFCLICLGNLTKLLFFSDLTNNVALDMLGINNSNNVKVCTAVYIQNVSLKGIIVHFLCTCIKKIAFKLHKRGTLLKENIFYFLCYLIS